MSKEKQITVSVFFYRGTKTPEDENREQVETSGLETEATLHTYMDILFKLGFSTFCICVKDPESRLWQTDV